MDTTLDSEVVIVGAGPTGLMLANILGMYGRTVTVLEAQARHVPDPARLNLIRRRVFTHHGRVASNFRKGRCSTQESTSRTRQRQPGDYRSRLRSRTRRGQTGTQRIRFRGELAVVADRQHQWPVGRREHLVRGDARMPVAHRLRDHPCSDVAGGLVGQGRQQRRQQVHLHPLALARPVPVPQRGQDAEGRVQAGDNVDDGDTDLGWGWRDRGR